MTISNASTCPKCGCELKHYDRVDRLVRTKGGIKQKTKIRRLRCVGCNGLQRELPDYIFPYKQYESEIIQGVVDGLITCETIGFEDYPCEMTMIRWTREKHSPL